jgi:hypothetical protein
LEASYKHIRTRIAFADSDHILTEEIDRCINMIKNKDLTRLTRELATKNNMDFNNEKDELFGIY